MLDQFVPIHVCSHYSLLLGLSKPVQIAKRCAENNFTSCAITDFGSVAGAVAFIKACKKKNIKPILGCKFNLTKQDASIKNNDNRETTEVIVLAKNIQGWKGLIKATSFANRGEHVYYNKPRISLDKLASFAEGNWIIISGHMGSDFANCMFYNLAGAYLAKSEADVWNSMQEMYKGRFAEKVKEYQQLFGEENVYGGIHRLDQKNSLATKIVADTIEEMAPLLQLPCVALPSAYYPTKEDAADQRILLASSMETSLSDAPKKLEAKADYQSLSFFKSNNYHIPTLKEIVSLHKPEHIANTVKIAELCEAYNILNEPSIPNFPYPKGMTGAEYLRQLCREGWVKKIANKVPKELHEKYVERVKEELEVIAGYPLLIDYFLIVADYMKWARSKFICGKGRGSAAGSLVSNLLDITDLDPIEYGLIFSRFYNAGRATKERVSLPDIDCDFPIERRSEVKDYVRNKYGLDRVSEMLTFSRMQGRGALKDVLRAHESCSYDEMNRITECLPEESKISDQLQLMMEATGEASVIRWTLENMGEDLKQWCFIGEDGQLEGPLAKRFEQAIRLEGTKRSQGKHAAGIIISKEPLEEVCPMVYDESNDGLIAGMEMGDLEAIGMAKMDFLGVAVLDKIIGVQNLVRTGKLK